MRSSAWTIQINSQGEVSISTIFSNLPTEQKVESI